MTATSNLEQSLRTLIQYARWQIKEGANHHPTLPSAIAQAEAALTPQARAAEVEETVNKLMNDHFYFGANDRMRAALTTLLQNWKT